MKRRKLLALTGLSFIGFAGCTAIGGENGDATDDSSTDDTGDSYMPNSSTTQYTASVTELETSGPIDPSVEILSPHLRDPDEPFYLAVTLTNTGTQPVTFGERRQALMWLNDADPFMLVPEESAESVAAYDAESGYWVMEDGVGITHDYQMGTLEPGESHTELLYLLVGHGETPPSSLPSTITFATSFSASYASLAAGTGIPIEWEFSLEERDEEYDVLSVSSAVAIPLQYDVVLEQPVINDPEAPMHIELSLTNESDYSIEYGERRAAMFWKRAADGYVLYPVDTIPEDLYQWEAEVEEWIATDGLAVTAEYQIGELAPGETHTESHYVLFRNDGGDPGQAHPESLSFETTVAIEAIDSNPVEEVNATWELSLTSKNE